MTTLCRGWSGDGGARLRLWRRRLHGNGGLSWWVVRTNGGYRCLWAVNSAREGEHVEGMMVRFWIRVRLGKKEIRRKDYIRELLMGLDSRLG